MLLYNMLKIDNRQFPKKIVWLEIHSLVYRLTGLSKEELDWNIVEL